MMQEFLEKKILVADSERAVRYSLRKILGNLGAQVATATYGQEAIWNLENESFDMAILGVELPDKTGLEVLRYIRRNNINTNNINTPIILLTSRADMGAAICALRLGALDYLIKPIESDNIIAAVARGLRAQTRSCINENPML